MPVSREKVVLGWVREVGEKGERELELGGGTLVAGVGEENEDLEFVVLSGGLGEGRGRVEADVVVGFWSGFEDGGCAGGSAEAEGGGTG